MEETLQQGYAGITVIARSRANMLVSARSWTGFRRPTACDPVHPVVHPVGSGPEPRCPDHGVRAGPADAPTGDVVWAPDGWAGSVGVVPTTGDGPTCSLTGNIPFDR